MIRFHVEGSERVQRLVRDRAERAARTRPAFHAIADDFIEMERRRFRQAPNAEWPPLSRRWAARKRRIAPGRPMMVMSGRLRASLTQKGARYAIRRVTDKSMTAGTSAPHAHLHQKGARGGRLPARTLVDLTPSDRARWAEHLAGHIARRRTRSVGL